MSKRILVTGAGGFVGTYLIKELQKEQGNEIYGAVYKSTSDLSGLLPSDHIISGDLTDFAFAKSLIESSRPDVVYHLAAISIVHNSVDNALQVMHANTAVSYNILQALRQYAPSARFIAICSANEYGAVRDGSQPISETTPLRPLNPYAVSKVTQEMLALEYHLSYDLDVVMLRPFNHTGPGQTTDFVIPMLVKQFVAIQNVAEPVITVGNLDSVRDFTDVEDMVKAYVLAGKLGVSGEVYNIGSGQGYAVRQIITLLQDLTGLQVEIKSNPAQLRASDVPVLVADTTKFRTLTGWQPKIELSDTLSRILEYTKTNK